MNRWMQNVGLALVVALGMSGVAAAQGIPTGRLSGRVVDGAGAAVPGVKIEVSSPALQGQRVAQSDVNGDYVVPSLPPGDYSVRYELDGFEEQVRNLRLASSQVARLDVDMSVAAISETIEVVGESASVISEDNMRSTTLSQETLESLPGLRTQLAAVNLAAGVSATGPGGNFTISGAQSWENNYLINGVSVNDNVRGTPNTLFIEDAIEETTTSTAGVSAEYGRFAGGLVNTVTKSGGNEFHGSFRDTLSNQSWNSENRFSPKPEDKIRGIYEGTLGGRIVRDKLWFFLAGRQFETDAVATTQVLNLPYSATNEQERYEGKLTFSPTASHRVTGSYVDIAQTQLTGHGGLTNFLADYSGLHERTLPNTLLALNYSGVLTSNFFVEAQYSERSFKFEPAGGSDPALASGTPIADLANGIIFNEAIFCAICPDGGDERANENYLVKANYFLSSERFGAHDLVAGYDTFDDIRTSNNYQSPTNFIFNSDDSRVVDGKLVPVISSQADGGASYLSYYPIVASSLGTHFKTNSLFVNDRWRLNDKLSFNIGVRYDANDGKDAEGTKVTDDADWSPRLGVNWNPDGEGRWQVNASFARYIAALSGGVADSGSSAGNPATIQWSYFGPSINTPGQPVVSSEEAMRRVFAWFESVGGIDNEEFLQLVNIPGGGLVVGEGLKSTSADEISAGFVRSFGSRGSVRADVVHREYGNFYVTQRDRSTGTVKDANGDDVDLGVIRNDEDDRLKREYTGLQTTFNYRPSDAWTLGGSYTLSRARGNFEGENSGSGPIPSTIGSYPEYLEQSWFAPEGDLAIDQRHRGNVYAIFQAFRNDRHGLAVSLLQRYNSALSYSAIGAVRSSNFVTNPGYETPPSTVTYFYSGKGAFRMDDITSTDLGLNYSLFLGDVELFGQIDVTNLFNEDGVVNVNTTVLTALNPGSGLRPFNPFTETPVEGVHWRKGPNFGKALSANDLQAPRTFGLSVGVRF